MNKSAFFSLFFVLLAALAHPAAAQQYTQDSAPGKADAASANRAAGTPAPRVPVGTYNLGAGLINLKPGAYIASGGQGSVSRTMTPGRKSYPVAANQNSAAAYNARLARSQLVQKTRAADEIPSPFPAGY